MDLACRLALGKARLAFGDFGIVRLHRHIHLDDTRLQVRFRLVDGARPLADAFDDAVDLLVVIDPAVDFIERIRERDAGNTGGDERILQRHLGGRRRVVPRHLDGAHGRLHKGSRRGDDGQPRADRGGNGIFDRLSAFLIQSVEVFQRIERHLDAGFLIV